MADNMKRLRQLANKVENEEKLTEEEIEVECIKKRPLNQEGSFSILSFPSKSKFVLELP